MSCVMSKNEAHIPPVAIALALAPAILVAALTTGLAVSRNSPETPPARIADCHFIAEATGRLACYDGLAREQSPTPAKGGLAILPPD